MGIQKALNLILVIIFWVIGQPNAEGATIEVPVLKPISDAKVYKGRPNSNYKNGNLVASGSNAESYLKFQVSGTSGTPVRAKLRLYVTDGSTDDLRILSTGTNWNESTLTWNSKPAKREPALNDKGTVVIDGWVEFDVTSAITGEGTYSFGLSETSGGAAKFYSKESKGGKFSPELILNYSDSGSDSESVSNSDSGSDSESDPGVDPVPPPGPVDSTSTAARSADAFVESIGVVGHFNWGGTYWDTDFGRYAPILGESGIRYVRTQINWSSLSKLEYLYNEYGIRSNILLHPRGSDGLIDPSQIGGLLSKIKKLGVEKVVSIEGPNEYSKTKYDGNSDWAIQLRGFQKDAYLAKESDAQLKHLPLLAPTIWKRIHEDFVELGDVSAYADQANLHYYSGGRKPTDFGNDGSVKPIETALDYAHINVPNASISITETGYNNNADTTDSPWSTPEPTQAKYTLRLLGEAFKRNVSRSYIYALIDNTVFESRNKFYGLLRDDLSRKPVFYAIKNAVKILADPGPAFPRSTLEYALSGDLNDIVSVVTQKRDGRFYLLIWQDVDSIDRNASPPKELNPAPRTLTLDISKHGFSKVKMYHPTALGMSDPNDGALPIQTIDKPGSVSLKVPDHMMIIEMIP